MSDNKDNNKFPNPWGEDPSGLEDMLKKTQARLVTAFGRKSSKWGISYNGGPHFGISINALKLILAITIVLWLSTGFFVIQTEQEGVILRFGKYVRTVSHGLHYKLPTPIETVIPVTVTRINKEEIGFRSEGRTFTSKQQLMESTIAPESQMLTTDQNIVEINFQVLWVINDAKKFYFNVRDEGNENTVRSVAESAMREIIGLSTVVEVLAEERSKIEQDTKKLIQDMLDNYQMGVQIIGVQLLRSDPPQEVLDAYRDVQDAKQDQQREINTAEAYRNDIVPRARGEAEKILLDAEGYRDRVVADAQGDAARFNKVYEQYRGAKEVTRKRIYIEAMEDVLASMDKIIVDKGASNLVPYLPLSEVGKRKDEAVETKGGK